MTHLYYQSCLWMYSSPSQGVCSALWPLIGQTSVWSYQCLSLTRACCLSTAYFWNEDDSNMMIFNKIWETNGFMVIYNVTVIYCMFTPCWTCYLLLPRGLSPWLEFKASRNAFNQMELWGIFPQKSLADLIPILMGALVLCVSNAVDRGGTKQLHE